MISNTFENTPVRTVRGAAEVYEASATSKSGKTVILRDALEGESVKAKLSSKNLISVPTLDAEADKNRVLFEGSMTGDFVFSCLFNYSECKTPTAAQFSFVVDGVEKYMTRGSTDEREMALSGTLTKITFLNWGYGVGSVGQIQLEEGTVATEYMPYDMDFTGTEVMVSGKNLLSKDDYYYGSVEMNGVTFTINDDGSITANGTATKTTVFYIIGGGGTEALISINQKLKKGVPYTVSDNPPGASFSTYCIQYSINDSYYSPLNTTRTFTLTSDTDVLTRMYITVNAGVTANNITFHPQIEIGTEATDFEPYKPVYTRSAEADGTVRGINAYNPTTVLSTDEAIINAECNACLFYETISYDGDLQSFDLERTGDSKFFGFGVCQKANIKVRNADLSHKYTTSNRFRLLLDDIYITPYLNVSEVHKDENTNALSITAYDVLGKAAAITVADLALESPYTIGDFAASCASALGCGLALPSLPEFELSYAGGANFGGTETIREALNDVAEATQTIYYINYKNELVFKRLDADGEPDFTIDRENYFTLDSKTNRRLSAICSATDLGDNVEASMGYSGTTEYVRNNAFWTLREDIAELVEGALANVGGFTLNQFNCDWRGNYLLEVGDKIALQLKDGSTVESYFLNDSLSYNGGLRQTTQWEYIDTEETKNNPSSLGDLLKETYARVDKAERRIDIVASEADNFNSNIAQLQLTTDEISSLVSQNQIVLNDTVENVEAQLAELNTKVNQTAEELQISIEKIEGEGASRITTSTGFTFNEEGLRVAKSGSEMETAITEDGMTVYKKNKEVLTANNEGVKAIDLHATTYLIIGKNSRFEDYGSNRTACYWIGG